MEQGARTRLISFLVLALVLGTGVVLGVAWERRGADEVREPTRQEARDRDREHEDRDDRGDDRRDRRLIVDRVGLSPDQEERVDSIVDVYRDRLDELRREFRSSYRSQRRELVGRTRDDIRAVLTPEQRTRYDTLLARFDRKEEAERRDDRDHRDGSEADGHDGRERR